jgi:hypothetical protein
MKRREFAVLFGATLARWLLRAGTARAQSPALPPSQAPAPGSAPNSGQSPTPSVAHAGGGQSIGQVATVQGDATVTRAGATAAIALQVKDMIFKNDTLATGANSALGVTFDDETTFSLSANARIVIDEFVYQDGGAANSAFVTIALGTAAFVASEVAKTGDMKIATPTATMGIRGTTGVVDVPEGGAAGSGEPRIKLYPDADGHVGRIEVFDRQGARLGVLTQGASALALRPGPGGRLFGVPFRVPPQEAARDRGVLQRLFASHAIGRRMTSERRQSRGLSPHPQNVPRRPGGPQRPGDPRPQLRRPGGAQPQRGGAVRPPRRPRPSAPRGAKPPGSKDKH